jgi:hypothetical protein
MAGIVFPINPVISGIFRLAAVIAQRLPRKSNRGAASVSAKSISSKEGPVIGLSHATRADFATLRRLPKRMIMSFSFNAFAVEL